MKFSWKIVPYRHENKKKNIVEAYGAFRSLIELYCWEEKPRNGAVFERQFILDFNFNVAFECAT